MIEKVSIEKIPYDDLIRSLCGTPFYGHREGCGNIGKYETCPPIIPSFEKVFDLEKDFFIIYTEYNVGKFAEKIRTKYINDSRFKERGYPDNPKKGNEFVEKIKNKLHYIHPDWKNEYFPKPNPENWKSARNWYNPRRWQETDRKEHRKEIEKFKKKFPHLIISSSPEGMGINTTGMMSEIGVELNWTWPPIHNLENKIYRISIAGYKK